MKKDSCSASAHECSPAEDIFANGTIAPSLDVLQAKSCAPSAQEA